MARQRTGIEIVDPDGYRSKLADQLGGRQPLAVLAETPEALANLVAGRSADVLRARPFAGKWTPLEIIGHLADVEWVSGYRLRAILGDDRPTIIGMDQERWVEAQGHNERDASELLAAFRTLRQLNLALWRRLTPENLRRVGLHNERGEESLGTMLVLEAGHDLSHINQLHRYLAAIDEGKREA